MKILFVLLAVSVSSVWAGRPNDSFSFKESSCVCRNDQPVSMGDCANVCRGKKTGGADVLFADFQVGSVLAGSKLKTVKNWCYKYVIGDFSFPKCVIEATSEEGKKTQLTKFNFTQDNSLTVDVSSLEDDQKYSFRLTETSSKAQSLSFEIYIFDPIGYPLKTTSFNQYSCHPRNNNELKANFFFAAKLPPAALTGNETIVCHDTAKYGEHDSPEFPRLDLISPLATVWNPNNFLFYDHNGNGILDVNEVIAAKIKENGGQVSSNLRLFGHLSSPGSKEQNVEAGNASFERLGFVTSYWVDTKSFQSSCPSAKDLSAAGPVFKAMKDVLGNGTEGIYVADRSESEVRSYLFIRESDLRAVWFYNDNGVPTKPTEEQVQFQTIYFYHPLNKENPLVKQPNQKVYRVRATSDFSPGLTTLQAFTPDTVEMISYPSHDRKLGCIPKN